mgnify:FL=1
MTQHTPGPWRVGDAGRTIFGPPNGEPSPETIAEIRLRKNARLIAAAPELFEALKVCQVRIFMLEGSENNEYQTATDAIAKATG